MRNLQGENHTHTRFPLEPGVEVQRGRGANYFAAVGRFKSRPNGQRLVKTNYVSDMRKRP